MNSTKLDYGTVLEMVRKCLNDGTTYNLAVAFSEKCDGAAVEQIVAEQFYEAIKGTEILPLEDLAVVKLQRQDEILKEGNIYDVRECIETLLEEETGIFVSLQEFFDIDNDSYVFYLHSEAFDDLEDEEIEQLDALGINHENYTETGEKILKLLNITVTFAHYDLESLLAAMPLERYLFEMLDNPDQPISCNMKVADAYETEEEAEKEGFFWADEIDRWLRILIAVK